MVKKRQEEWKIVFFISLVVYLIGALVFILFARGETQAWAKNRDKYDLEEVEELNLN